MNYLVYIEHAAENLQFYLWYQDYLKRFQNLPPNERALAPEWNTEPVEVDLQAGQPGQGSKQQISVETAAIFKGTDFAHSSANVVEVKHGNPFNTPPRTSIEDHESLAPSDPAWSDWGSTLNGTNISNKSSHHKKAAGAFEGAELKWQPCTSLPANLGSLVLTDH